MKAIILAAGMGTRLGGDVPKPLTQLIEEKSIIDLQIEKLTPLVGRENIMLVLGYKKNQFMERFPDLTFAINDQYQFTNTAKSLLVALDTITGEDILWMNGDIYFDAEILELLTNVPGSAVLVDTKECGEEEIKYTVNEKGFIKELSKQVQHAKGEGLGINLIRHIDLENFKEQLKAVEANDYFEKALENLTLSDSIDLTPIDIEKAFCQEIDFPEDLQTVRAHIKKT